MSKIMQEFRDRQKQILYAELEELRTMPPEEVNEVLATLDKTVANSFLRQLGHVRAKDIYDQEES